MIQCLYKSKILLQAENSPTIAILLHFNGIRKEENTSSREHRSSLLILQYSKKAMLVLVVSFVQWLVHWHLCWMTLSKMYLYFFQNVNSLLCFGKETDSTMQSIEDHFFQTSSTVILFLDAEQGATA